MCRLGPTIDLANLAQESLTKSRDAGPLRRKNFCVVASNPENIRNYFISRLSELAPVEIFGKLGSATDNKHKTLQEYNFNICFENDLYPGYVTEKAIESYLSGCIPVWRGLDASTYLNQEAIVDITNLSVEEGVQRVLEISNNKELMQRMRNSPLLNKTIDLNLIIRQLKNANQTE